MSQAKTPTVLRGAAFFDRDGVLNVDKGYIHRAQDVEWVAGAAEAVAAANAAGLVVVVATNQAGVARGFYTEDDIHALHDWMAAELAARGARIDAFYHCPFHAEAAIEAYRHANHPDRKPNPGMLMRAIADHGLSPAASFMIGDNVWDVQAAEAAGVRGYLFDGSDLVGLVQRAIADLAVQGG